MFVGFGLAFHFSPIACLLSTKPNTQMNTSIIIDMGFIHTIIFILFEIVNVFSRIAKNGDELGRDSTV